MPRNVILYIHGCQTCGVTAAHIRRVKRLGFEPDIKNTKYDAQARAEHSTYLVNNSLDVSGYPPIVVEGDTVTLLKEWRP